MACRPDGIPFLNKTNITLFVGSGVERKRNVKQQRKRFYVETET